MLLKVEESNILTSLQWDVTCLRLYGQNYGLDGLSVILCLWSPPPPLIIVVSNTRPAQNLGEQLWMEGRRKVRIKSLTHRPVTKRDLKQEKSFFGLSTFLLLVVAVVSGSLTVRSKTSWVKLLVSYFTVDVLWIIGHFQVIKPPLSNWGQVHSISHENEFYLREWKNPYQSISRAEQLTLFRYRGPGKLENGLLTLKSQEWPTSIFS